MSKLRLAHGGFVLAALAISSARAEPLTSVDLMSRYQIKKSAVDQWLGGQLAPANQVSAASAIAASTSMTSEASATFTRDLEVTGNTAVFGVDPSETAPNTKDPDEEMFRVAQTMGVLRGELKSAGYPSTVYEGTIRNFEWGAAKAVAAGEANPIYSAPAMRALIADINAVRADTYPSLPPVQYLAVAYASAVRPVILQSRPEGGRVWVLTQLRFDVCKRSIADPYDRDKCPQWREADAKNPMYIAGTYAFQVQWGNGRKAQGQRTIYNAGSDAPVVYNLP